jgi:hypothetical protein
MKIGVTTAQACKFIADSIIRQISHYVPAIAVKHVPQAMVFSACEPLLYNHLLPTRFLVKQIENERGTIETSASLFANFWGWVWIKSPMTLLWKIWIGFSWRFQVVDYFQGKLCSLLRKTSVAEQSPVFIR